LTAEHPKGEGEKRFQAVEITEALAEYGDGEVIRTNGSWYFKKQGSGIIQVGDNLPADRTTVRPNGWGSVSANLFMLPRHDDVTIIIKGHLFKADGEKAAFEEIILRNDGYMRPNFTWARASEQDATFQASVSFTAQSKREISTFWSDLLP
jgi:hypothetical protein